MRSKQINIIAAPILVLSLLVPLTPALAQQSEPPAKRFELGLATASTAPELDFVLLVEPQDAAASEQPEATEIRLSEVRAEAWALSEEGDDAGAQIKPKKTKRWIGWLKKRWYVPVLAAVALGVALDDDDSGDNDSTGEED